MGQEMGCSTANGQPAGKAAIEAAPTKPPPIVVAPEGIPERLRGLPQWVCWRWEQRQDQKTGARKWTKPPINPRGERHADVASGRRDTWLPFAEAFAYLRSGKADGVGFVFAERLNLFGVDLDDCRDPATGEIAPWALQIIAKLNTYAEASPSRTGVKLIGEGKVPAGGNRKGKIEFYSKGRYFTITGQRLEQAPATVEPRQAELDQVHAAVFKGPPASPHPPSANGNGHPAAIDLADATLLAKAMAAKNSAKFRALWSGDTTAYGGDDSAADLALCGQLAFWCGPDPARIDQLFRQSGLMRPKWDEKHYSDGRTYGQATIAKALEGKTKFYKPKHRRPARSGQTSSPPVDRPIPDQVLFFWNYYEEGGEDCEPSKKGYSLQYLHALLNQLTVCRYGSEFPKRAHNLLFVPGPDHKPLWMPDPVDLFAWIGRLLPASSDNCMRWGKSSDMVSETRFHAYLHQVVENFQAVEPLPHYPTLPGHYYLHPQPEGGDGSAFRELLDRFKPATQIDYDLIQAFFLSLFAGLQPGQRPAWLFTSDAANDDTGRGVGKSTVAKMAGRLIGGFIRVSPEEDFDKLMPRLLSPEAFERRMVCLDNVKTLRFSWSELEGLVTADTISGRQLYVGEGRRPNTITWTITLNGANLSTDLAQRCVIVKLARPDYSATWEDETFALIDSKRWKIIGDILDMLQEPASAPLIRHSRWGAWEDAVLSRVADPFECQRVIEERQAEVDDDRAKANLVREHFVAELRRRNHNPDTDVVWLPSKVAALFLNEALDEKQPVNRANIVLGNLGLSCLRKSDRQGQRGWTWTGFKAAAEQHAMDLREPPIQWDAGFR